jgi:hypothetical protein
MSKYVVLYEEEMTISNSMGNGISVPTVITTTQVERFSSIDDALEFIQSGYGGVLLETVSLAVAKAHDV